MARAELRRPENVPGPVFVDASCIDCDTCRWMAPETFARRGAQSAVVAQPADAAGRRRAAQAAVACPTASIAAPGMAEAARDFPLPIAPGVEGVLHCGYHSPDSFGATSYLVRRPDGNLLVDSPRFAAPLVRRLEELGGASWMLLTHRDDVADHERFAGHFGLRRVIHRRDAPAFGGTFEQFVTGERPVPVAPGVTAIPTPGHTAGHMCFLVEGGRGPEASGLPAESRTPDRFLFTGDHLAWDDDAGRLEAWPDVCWHDWGEQTDSMRRLAGLDVDWVLPGHGRGHRVGRDRWKAEVERLVAWMEGQG